LPALGCNFPIPFFIVEGDDDRFTYTKEAEEYFECVKAPHKEMILVPGGHFVAMTNAEAFLQVLVQRVRPFAMQRF
jgi:pimeloyl-ACP methyl ester carboxylesterase